MIRLGLTGSIGMGKTTTAAMFAEEGIAVLSADDIVHRLYDGPAAALVEREFPGVTSNDRVDRERLSLQVMGNDEALARLEEIIHPLVRAQEARMLKAWQAEGRDIVLLDIPLLFETGGDERVDRIVVVTCDGDIQRKRVLARPGMTEDKFDAILARQLPDEEKRTRADYLIDTGKGLEAARKSVRAIIADLRKNDQTAASGQGRADPPRGDEQASRHVARTEAKQ